jgi:hypothetical protein
VWGYLLVYVLGLCGGVAANVLLDVQLRRPALSKQITLAAFGVMLAIIVSQFDAPRLQDWLLTALWGATGLLAGLGSRESRAPLA